MKLTLKNNFCDDTDKMAVTFLSALFVLIVLILTRICCTYFFFFFKFSTALHSMLDFSSQIRNQLVPPAVEVQSLTTEESTKEVPKL